MAISPEDVAQLLTEMNARITALETTLGKIPIRYVVTYDDGTVVTYDMTPAL